ncbi:MAG TPA: ECF-type sigma factor [Thermoanaerobaculia bacterium]|jgi:RNA polymerase sigma factor (TIGR02999 family)|nr:ECF-type sigma factor [Thermoanaerobaculia bacterium]
MSISDVTTLLHAARQGDRGAGEELFARLYTDLKRLARAQLARGRRPGETLDTTVLVHESYLRLGGGSHLDAESRAHFFNLAARVMRNVVVDFARRRDAEKRGAALRVSWPEGMDPAAGGEGSEVDLLALDTALARLQEESPRLARVVELRFFAGLALEEIAGLLDVGERTLKRDWRKARAFLLAELRDDRRP